MLYRKTRITLLLLSIVLLHTFFPSQACAAQGNERFCVVETVPVTTEPGSQNGDSQDLPAGSGRLLYGNHIMGSQAKEPFRNDWLKLAGEAGGPSRYVLRKALLPVPPFTATEPRYYWCKKNGATLYLSPGSLPLSSKGRYFAPLRGETLTSVGERKGDDGKSWLLFRFTTSEWTEDMGPELRYAWGHAEDYMPLSGYRPDFTAISAKGMPTHIRGNIRGDSGGHTFGLFERSAIAKNGFHIDTTPTTRRSIIVDEMSDSYALSELYTPHFITTDLFFHSLRIIYGGMLARIEERYLIGALTNYLKAALTGLDIRISEIMATHPAPPRDALTVARDMLALPLALLDHPGKAQEKGLSPIALAEYERILAARITAHSVVTGSLTDYSLYKPRGHYAKTPSLSRYFRASTFLGEASLPLEVPSAQMRRRNATAIALLCLVTDDPSVRPLYDRVVKPVFMISGHQDGTTVDDLAAPSRKALALENIIFRTAAETDKLHAALLAAAKPLAIPDLPAGQAKKSGTFRLIGKPFTLDSYIFSRLTSPATGDDEESRRSSKPEDLMAVLGSKPAYLLTNEYAANYRNYGFNRRILIEKTPPYLASRRADTIHSAWLRAISASFADSSSQQFFYRSPAWEWKKLLTGCAAWTELRQEPLLYIKQSTVPAGGGNMGVGEYEPPRPRGYVEPAPHVFARMAEIAAKMKETLEYLRSAHGYKDEEYLSKTQEYIALSQLARDIAEKEVRFAKLTPEDFADIERIAHTFSGQLLLDDRNFAPEPMPVLVDISTNYEDGQTLYAAVGFPQRIFVFVDDNSGGPRVTVGYIYSYMEFTKPISSGRITNAEWRRILRENDTKKQLEAIQPAWYDELRK